MAFEKIFSKKQLKKENLPKIKIDFREKNSLVPSSLKNIGVNFEFKSLNAGDYIINNIVIERKTVDDFLNSMINKRTHKQLLKLKEYENKLMIIEGILEKDLYNDHQKNRINPDSVRGFLISIALKHKIPIIFTKNPSDTAKFIKVIANKKNSQEFSLNHNRKSKDIKETIQIILESFPRIGPKTARKLLKKFGTIKGIVNAKEKELKEVIGKKGEILYKLINEKF